MVRSCLGRKTSSKMKLISIVVDTSPKLSIHTESVAVILNATDRANPVRMPCA